MDRLFVISALIYAILGMVLGIVMAASKDHGQLVTHAHILLLGFVVSFIYALCHKLWLKGINLKLAWSQFVLHHLGAFFVSFGLFLLYGGHLAIELLDPVLAAASSAALIGMVLMLIMFVISRDETEVAG